MLDVNKVMKDLARVRPVFHSEADFQHALAWHIHEIELDPRVRLEWPVKPPDPEKRIYVDLYLPGRKIAVELKYLTRKLNHEHEGERFELRDQRAQDVRRYDFLKDIQRLEQLSLSDSTDVQAGFAVLLTNDPLYWTPPGLKGVIDAALRLHEGRRIEKGKKMAFHKRASTGTTEGRKAPIRLKDSYDLEWREYSKVGDGANQRFRYLAIQIGCLGKLGKQQ